MKLKSLAMVIIVPLGVFALGALLMNFIVMPLLVHQRTSVIVPDVRGVSEQQAKRSVERLGLQFQIDRSEHHPEIPLGYVLSQRPRPNETVKGGRSVSVVVSLGPHTQRVPDLKSLSLRQGRLLLSRQKLNVGRVARILREGGTGSGETVMAFAPRAGSEVEEGSEVDMLVGVAGWPRRYLMPDLEGQDLLFIREKLVEMGFRVGNVQYEVREGVFPNTILDQRPRPGVMIREGDSIELVAAGTR